MQPLAHAHRGSLSVTAFFASAQLLTESEGGSSPLVHVLDLSPETEYASRKRRSLCFSCLCDGEGRADVLDHMWGHARRLRGPVLVREPFITSWEWVASLYQIRELFTSSDPTINVEKWFWGSQWMGHECFSNEDISSIDQRPDVGRGKSSGQIVSYDFHSKRKCVPVGKWSTKKVWISLW